MKQEKTRALYEYWNRVRGDRPAPRRLEIEPGAIASLLPNIFILEQVDPVTYRFRLAGTHVCAYFGRELRQRLFTSLWPTTERKAVESLLSSISQDASGIVAGLEGSERGGRVAQFELLLLPLATRSERFDRVLGSIAATQSPYWLGNWPLSAVHLKSVRVLWPSGRPAIVHHPAALDVANLRLLPAKTRLTVIDGGRTGVA